MIQLSRGMGEMLAVLIGLTAGAVSAVEPMPSVRPSARLLSAAFSPDGRTLAALDREGMIRLWDVATAKERKKSALARRPEEVAKQIRYTPNGDLAVVLLRYQGFKFEAGWATQGTISACLCNVTSGQRSPYVEVGYGGLAVCPRGERLAYSDGLWDVDSGRKLHKVTLPAGLVFHIEFSPDGRAVAYRICESLAQEGSLIFIADAVTGKKLLQVGEFDWNRGRLSFVSAAVFTPDGKAVATPAPDGPAIEVRDLATGRKVQTFALAEPESVVGFAPDGRTLVSWQQAGGTVRLWEKRTGKERHTVKVERWADAVLVAPDGRTVAVLKEGAVQFRKLAD